MFLNTVLIGTFSTSRQYLEHNHFLELRRCWTKLNNRKWNAFDIRFLSFHKSKQNHQFCFSFAKEPTRTYISWYFVGPNFFLLGTSWSKIISHVYFVGPKFFVGSVCFSWLISWFKGFQSLAAWEESKKTEVNKYISNHVFYSKTISMTVGSVYMREVFYLLN